MLFVLRGAEGCLSSFLGRLVEKREICSDVAEIAVHGEMVAIMQINALSAWFIALLKTVRKNVSLNCALDAAQWLLGDDKCADVAALTIKAPTAAAALDYPLHN